MRRLNLTIDRRGLAVSLRQMGIALMVAAFVLAMFFPEQVSWIEATALAVGGAAGWITGLLRVERARDSA